MEEQKKQLSDQISRLRLDLRQMKQKRLDAQTMRDSLIHFSQILEAATPEEQKALVPRIVESITFTPTEIEIALFDQMIERGLLNLSPTVNHSSNGALELSRWLPDPTSQRTISAAKHRFPIYLAYDGHGIGIFVGIAPIESDDTGVVTSDRLRAMELNHKWQNPLRLALRYQALLENSKTKADIARMMGSSRARVTQIMSLLELHPDIQEYLNKAKHDLNAKLLTERKLRDIAAIQNNENQLAAFRKLIL